ncbi:Matrix-remodeling-associated protein 5 [Collichthys lucidus]|uniref:Matrix-remodeling-associated protein 5 n=1 Tax=Collichthys lucidus TaxID=240159 RepID=A0A4U5UDP1_COLLU|nr:Matrix-remodeling-associated protein 5 [Collichthys lucidus]
MEVKTLREGGRGAVKAGREEEEMNGGGEGRSISLANAIPSCPQSCSCPGVKEVHCTFRHLTAIPKTFPKDTERLNFGYNSLTEVEGSEFRSLRQLEMLMLHGNDISTVHPGAFYSLRSLQILKLSYNKLTSVNPGLFEGLVGLIRLHLDHNLIDFIEPYSFSGLTSLKLLQLEGNLLKEIHPHTFITVSLLGSFWTSGLKHLHLSDNLLEQLPAAALNTAPRLELLSLHGNPWTCDCQLNWLVEWSATHEGIIKCKKERGASEVCPQCSSPRPLNGTSLLGLTPDKLTCERPALRSSLKQWDNPVWAESEAEPDLPYTRDFEKPLGHITIVLSDSHGNNAHVACGVRHPGESLPMTWIVNPLSPGELSVNVSLATVLECEIDRETLQNLWQLVAYYYESPAILERGQQKGNASRITYQYSQAVNENSPYFTDLKGYLVAEPSWLLQPRVTLRLNRRQTTTKKLVMDFTTVITKNINSHRGQEDDNAMSWALIRRGTSGRIQTALDGTKVHLECIVVTSDPDVKVEWMLPDLSIVEDATEKMEISERGELVILNATLSDSGLYHCMVRTKAGVDLMPLRLTIKEHTLSPTALNGSGSHLVPTHRPWSLPHPWAHNPVVTNRPEITAETVKPTPTVPGTTGNSRFTHSDRHISHHNQHQNHHVDVRTQTRDQLFLLRLRNRYRQVQLDRIAQLGRIVTPKPRTSYYNPPFPITSKPYTPKPPAPTASYTSTSKPAKPSSSSFSGFNPTPHSYHPTTPGVLYGGRWPVGGRISSRRPTAAPPFPWVLGSENDGMKPRITTVATASVSVLAESDVVLPCKASGNPEANIAWTKVSTGATIPANTKLGPRFEVFKNGTFLIKNIQLQDRGQYLCTAQNRFGSDRMVITLAVQTEAPKIQPPKSTEIAVYLGKGVTLDCSASGKPPAQISWILPDRTFVRDVGTVQTQLSPMSLLQNGTLQIHSPNFSSKGDYKCIASNAAGADTITYHLHVAALPPSISEGAMDTVIIPPGRSVYVHCSVKGEPVPTLKWTLPGGVHVKPSQFLGRRLFVFPNGTLYVKNVSPVDAGRYECLATNPVGMAKRTVQLEVRANSPSVSHQPPAPLPIPPTHRHGVPSRQHSVSAMYGSAVYLHCPESSGSPRGTIWQLPSKTIMEHRYSPERPIKVFRNGTLRILQLTELDGGSYLCVFQRPNGEDMELFQVDCVATGLPDPEVSWSLPDGTMINNALQSDDSGLRNRRYVIFGNGTLLLQQMGKKDEGDYTCFAKNKLGKDERKEPFINGVKGKTTTKALAVSYQTALLDCRVEGKPEPRVWWVTPYGQSLPTPYLGGRFQVHRNGSLELRGVRKTDEGRYMCLAKNNLGDSSLLVELDIASIAEKPSFAVPNIEILPIKQDGGLISLECPARGKPNPEFAWVLPNGTMLTPGVRLQRFTHHLGNGTLQISQPVPSDKGVYRCLAKNVAGQAEKRYALEAGRKPVIRGSTGGMKITYGNILNLPCTVDGWPQASITWTLPNGLVLDKPQTISRISFFLNGTLQLRQVATFDKGTYTCKASNSFGSSTLSYPVAVMVFPPRITNTLTSITRVSRGSPVTLNCVATGIPKPDISWTLPGRTTLVPHNRFTVQGGIHMTEEGSLIIQNPVLMNSGIYKCNAKNALGTDFKSTYLQVV